MAKRDDTDRAGQQRPAATAPVPSGSSDDSRIRPAALVIAGVLALVTSLVLLRAVLTDEAPGSGASGAGATSAPSTADDDAQSDGSTGTGSTDEGATDDGATDDPATDDPAADDPAAEDAGSGGPGAAVAAAVATRHSRCVSADRSLTQALDTAQPAIDQWSIHVGAMNKLVVGEITLGQASAFWKRTRVGAQRRISEFRDHMTEVRSLGVDCPAPHYLAPGATDLPDCARRVRAAVRALGAARTSMATWEHHVHDMEMLRLGDLSPEDATAAWLSMWQEGVRDLDGYDAATRQLQQHDACVAPTSS